MMRNHHIFSQCSFGLADDKGDEDKGVPSLFLPVRCGCKIHENLSTAGSILQLCAIFSGMLLQKSVTTV